LERRFSRALFIGRFQPFHLGHLAALKWILKREDAVVIGIGSAQYSHDPRNPFTAGERVEMIWRVLRAEGLLDRCVIVTIPDTDRRHALWVSVVLHYSPPFDRVYTNDPLSQLLFREAGMEVRPIPMFNREEYSATKIRELIARGESWEHLVPAEVAEFIKEVRGDVRIREIYGALSSGRS